MGSFPAAYDITSVLEAPGGAAAAATLDAPLVALEGVLNRTRPLAKFHQLGDRRPRAHGIHPLVVQSPMVDDAAAHAAMTFIYTAATRGAERGLWPVIPKAPPGGVGSGPLLLGAAHATEAGIAEALAMLLGGQEYCNLHPSASSTAASPSQSEGRTAPYPPGAPPAPAAPGGEAAAAAPPAPAAGRVVTGEMRARMQSWLPQLPGTVKDDLQVRWDKGACAGAALAACRRTHSRHG